MTGPTPPDSSAPSPGQSRARDVGEVLWVSLGLGLTAFGGPVAHLAWFERTYVQRRGWLSADHYASLVALCQALPGPASSQVGFLIGLHRAGGWGALAAWFGFTLPSALLLLAAAIWAGSLDPALAAPLVHGLKLVAVIVVAQALLHMGRRLCTDAPTRTLAVLSALWVLAAAGPAAQLAVLALGATAGAVSGARPVAIAALPATAVTAGMAWKLLALFLLLLCGLPLAAHLMPGSAVELADAFYRAGALVFGGGHVVLPLLHEVTVAPGRVTEDAFLTGYGLAQAVPGPLFTFAAYLGAHWTVQDSPLAGGLLALTMLFLPGLLLAATGAALWDSINRQPRLAGALRGVNAAVVGLLAAALYDPVWIQGVRSWWDLPIVLAGIWLLERRACSPLWLVVACVALSPALSLGLAGIGRLADGL